MDEDWIDNPDHSVFDQVHNLVGNMNEYHMGSNGGAIFTSADVLYTILFSLFTMAIIAPPTEVVAAGLTVENVFSSFLGSEQLHFVYYHVKRTAVVRIVHSFLPLVYYIYMCWISTSVNFFQLKSLYGFWELFSIAAIILPVLSVVQVHVWYRTGWLGHPVVRRLSILAANNVASTAQGQSMSSWRSVATAINIEFRRAEKFVTGTVPSRRIAITDNWIIRASTYYMEVAHQSDTLLTVEKCEDHQLSHEGGLGGIQILNIAVSSVTQRRLYFRIRLNAVEYQDVKDKLTAPLREAQGVVIRQSLSEQFIEAFRSQISENPPFILPPEMEVEQCIGCMQKMADVKLTKGCADDAQGDCRSCFCRPMWCLNCMARWFASRQLQDGHEPATWMTRRAPCPTCRSPFCILDVRHLVDVPLS